MNSKSDIKRNIALIGMPGSGKTSIGKKIAEILGLPFYDVDEYIEAKEGRQIKAIFLQGEDYFRKLESKAIEEISKNVPSVIATGGGTVKIASNMEVLKENSIIFFINRPIENIVKDVDISTRPLLAEGTARLYRLYEERFPLYKKYSNIEISNDKALEEAAAEIVKLTETENLIDAY